MRAIELTQTSWILYDDNQEKIGIAVKHINKYTILTTNGYSDYESLEQLQLRYGDIKFKEREIAENKEITVAGFPIDVNEIYDTDEEGEIPSFKKTPTSKIRYAVGYWGLKYSDQYVQAFCPKISTLKSYDYIGPFKSKFLLRDEMLIANKRLNNEQ